METIKTLQHNVLHSSFNLTNTYLTISPHTVLINSHGIKETENIHIFRYNSYSKNMYIEINDGIAILVKNSVKLQIKDDYISNCLEIIVETTLGKLSVATTNLRTAKNVTLTVSRHTQDGLQQPSDSHFGRCERAKSETKSQH